MADTKVAVITGARRGLGLGTAKALAAEGYHVIVTARSEEAADEGVLAVEGAEGRALDVRDDAAVDAFFAWLGETQGRVDVLVNNAGIYGKGGDVLGVTAAELAATIDNNALSAWRMIRLALPMMNAAGTGRIVNVSSGMGGLTEMGGGALDYRISKVALNAITRVAAREAKANVKVNAVCPGWVQTDMGGPGATRTLEEGVASIMWAAVLPDDGPSGGFFRDGRPLAW